jgi:hypothetical protein
MDPHLVRALKKKQIPRANYALGMTTFVFFRKLFSRGLWRLARVAGRAQHTGDAASSIGVWPASMAV